MVELAVYGIRCSIEASHPVYLAFGDILRLFIISIGSLIVLGSLRIFEVPQKLWPFVVIHLALVHIWRDVERALGSPSPEHE